MKPKLYELNATEYFTLKDTGMLYEAYPEATGYWEVDCDHWQELRGMIFAIDFDGTCVTHKYPQVGRFIGAEAVLSRLVNNRVKLVLWTMRSGDTLNDAVKWFENNQIPLYGVNNNPDQLSWTESPKAYAQVYIDDAALGAPLCDGLTGERPYIDWDKVTAMIDDLIESRIDS